jgi:DUF1365 family protein
MARSALYLGTVRHRRATGPGHSFQYRIWNALLDLDELPRLADTIPVFSHNRFNLTGFDDRDHMGVERLPVRAKLNRWLKDRGIAPPTGPVYLLAQLRVLGHVFNPVSFFFCHDSDGHIQNVVAEVNNTFGESFCYLLEADVSETVVRDEHDKVFHVSPFQPLSGRYRFRVTVPGNRTTAHIDVLRDGQRVFDATMTGQRRALTTGSLLATVARHPHIGLRTLALIHYQALRLWLKRAPFFTKPEPPPGSWRTHHG